MARKADDPRLVVTFPVELPANTSAEQMEQWLRPAASPRCRPSARLRGKLLDVVADRFRLGNRFRGLARGRGHRRLALKRGGGRLAVYVAMESVARGAWDLWRFSTGLHCPRSDLRYSADPMPSMFSFNSRRAPATPAAVLAA